MDPAPKWSSKIIYQQILNPFYNLCNNSKILIQAVIAVVPLCPVVLQKPSKKYCNTKLKKLCAFESPVNSTSAKNPGISERDR